MDPTNTPASELGKKITLEARGDPNILGTVFDDIADYHPALIRKILELEHDPVLSNYLFRGGCGRKIYHIHQWGIPEAQLIHDRAIALFKQVAKSPDAAVDISWANVYRKGEYCMPHSHERSAASIVYCVETGDDDPDDPLAGRFVFVDPRIAACCLKKPGYMTTPFLPEWVAGTMIIFPSQLVHSVNPYMGETPRITMSWNINKHSLPGSADEQWKTT
jgi:hypothetical protein